MRKILPLLVAVISLFVMTAGRAPSQHSSPLLLLHATIIDATGAAPKTDMSVIISGGRITGLGPARELPVPAGARVVDAIGKFLIPGLWDMHIHLDDPELWPTHVSREEKERVFPLLIANGITGVRDMGGSLEQLQEWRQKIILGQMLGPRMVISGPFVDGNYPEFDWLGSLRVTTEAEGREAVRSLHRRGADFIKVYNTIPRAAYFGLADEAKKLGVVFAGHVPDRIGAAEASDAGQKSMEHMQGLLLACSAKEDAFRKEIAETYDEPKAALTPLDRGDPAVLASFSKEKCDALFARFARNGTWQCPTLHNNWRHAHSFDKVLTNDPRACYYPRSFREYWKKRSLDDQKHPEREARLQAYYLKLFALVTDMRRAGVNILAGSDAGANEYSFPGFSLHDELAELVAAGLTPMEALQSSTLNAAKYLGMADAFGTVEAGKMADLVLLEANPLDDINNTRKIAGVILGGRLIDKVELQQLLANSACRNK
jgi:imidazolonepropionase-like amidohydrolase